MPIRFDEYVFPGGDVSFNTTGGIGLGPDSTTAPRGGEKQIPNQPTAAETFYLAMLNKLNISFEDPIYFQYSYVPIGVGFDASVEITALADMNVSDGPAHQVFQRVSVDVNTQEVNVGPPATYNEFR
jgi:hypothetical protein